MKNSAFTGLLASMLSLSFLFAGCGQATSESQLNIPSSESIADNTGTEQETDPYEYALSALSGSSYEDRAFNLLTRKNEVFELESEQLTGEITNDAIYNRNRWIEDTYGVEIGVTAPGNWDDVTNKMKSSVMAGDHSYDLVCQTDFKTYALVGAGLCGNWLDVPVIDFTAPWWTTAANNEATINGRLYTVTGDYCVTNIIYGNVYFYNAELCANYGITAESLQQSVFDGSWTFDHFNSLVRDVYEDLDGDSQRGENDLYGAALTPNGTLDAWLTAFEQPLTAVNNDGVIEVKMFTDKTASALEKVLSLYYENVGSYNPGSWKDVFPMFVSNHALFVPATFNAARTDFHDMKNEFGIMPYPKWDEKQSNYYMVASDQFTVLAFPLDTPTEDYEFLGTITEALSITSKRDVTPAFYDSALKNRYSMDANTARIVDIIMDGRMFEFSFQYGNEVELPYVFRNQVIGNNRDIMSYYAKNESKISAALERIAAYYGLED